MPLCLLQARKATVEEMQAVVEFLQGQGLSIEQVQKARPSSKIGTRVCFAGPLI